MRTTGQTFGELSAQLNQGAEPAERLKALLAALTQRKERLASYGCRIGSLSSELGKRDDDLRAEVAVILAGLIDWAEAQFREMGREDARELATALIAAYEGIAVLASALRDPSLISTETSRLSRWIDSLAKPQPPGRSLRREQQAAASHQPYAATVASRGRAESSSWLKSAM